MVGVFVLDLGHVIQLHQPHVESMASTIGLDTGDPAGDGSAKVKKQSLGDSDKKESTRQEQFVDSSQRAKEFEPLRLPRNTH